MATVKDMRAFGDGFVVYVEPNDGLAGYKASRARISEMEAWMRDNLPAKSWEQVFAGSVMRGFWFQTATAATLFKLRFSE